MVWLILLFLAVLIFFIMLSRGTGTLDAQKIKTLIEEGRLEEARKILKQKLNRNNSNPILHWLIAIVFEREVNFEYAIVELKGLVKNRMYNQLVQREDVLVKLADLYEKVGKPGDALPLIVEEHKIRWNQTTLYLLGHICLLLNETEKAQGYITKVLTIQPNYAPALTDQGIIHKKNGNIAKAIETLEAAVGFDKKFFPASFHLGESYMEKNELDKAIKSFEISRFERDLRIRSMYNISNCYKRKEMNKNAIEQLERVVTEWDSTFYYSKIMPAAFIVEARYQLAERYFEDKDYQSALDQWREIQTIAPEYKDVNSKIISNSRLGKNRIQDFIIAPAGEFEKICLFMMENMGMHVVKLHQETKEKVICYALEDVAGRQRKTLAWFIRHGTPATENIMKEFDNQMKMDDLHSGYLFSPSGFAPSAIKFIFDKPIKMMGRGQFVKMLRAYENRLHEKAKPGDDKE